jgi:crotonobetainyl-CoA:carnitine CoA-transferase CaiB-like acyl-CoA transferase
MSIEIAADTNAVPGSRPLAGYTVIDFTRILSGPYATMLLADLGAEVIKIERPSHGDDTRGWGPPFWHGMSTYFAAVNRGKRSVAVDLATTPGREIVQELIEQADVVVENFRPGVTERLGISYGQLRERNPRLVYASINGFGSYGPRAQEAGTEVIVEAESGLMAMMGVPDGPPVRFGVAMVDIATGTALVNGVLAALLERTRTGVGRAMEFPLYTTAISVLSTVIASSSVAPETQQARFGSGHPSIVPYSAFEGSDGWVVLGAVNEGMWARLCTALALGHVVADERCASNEARVHNRAFVESVIADAVRGQTVAEITRRLGRQGVLVAPVRTASEAIRDPQVEVLGLLDSIDGVHFSRTPLAQFNPDGLVRAPSLGEHSSEVLAAHGCSRERISDLIEAGVVQDAELAPAEPPRDPGPTDLARHANT